MAKDQTIKNSGIKFLPYLLFFSGSFVFFGFFADYVEFYQEKLSLFVFSHDYLIDNLNQPGSLLIYLGRFLTTFFYNPVAGAIIISLIICLIIYLVSKIINYLSGRESIIIPLITGTLFFILQTNYQYLLYNNLGVLLQLAFFFLAIRYERIYPCCFIPAVVLDHRRICLDISADVHFFSGSEINKQKLAPDHFIICCQFPVSLCSERVFNLSAI